jgi:hypothetical protein
MRKSVIFYRSFYDAICDLPTEHFAQITKAIMQYGLDGIEPELPPLLKGYFVLIRPQIDANITKYENGVKGKESGAKGGRPPKSEQQENPKETPRKPQEYPTITPKEKDKVKEKDKEKEKDKGKENEKENISEKNETRFSDEKPQNNISLITSENPAESKQQKKQSAAELYQADCKNLVVMINDLFKKCQASGRPVTKKYHNLAQQFYQHWSAKKGSRAFFAKKETFVINLRFNTFCKNAGLVWPPPLYEPPKMIPPKVTVDVEPLLKRKHTMDATMMAEYERDMAIIDAACEAGLLYYEKKDESND